MYSYNPDRRELSEVKLLNLEPWRIYPHGADLNAEFLEARRPDRPRISSTTPIAAIGSCFAREIKNWLKSNGYTFVETADGPCTGAGSARYDRVYNTFTLRQEFERAFATFSPKQTHWEFMEDGTLRLLDPYRKGVAWESREEMASELAEHQRNTRRAFSEAEIVIITVGQAEIWYDKADGYVYPLVPPVQVFNPAKHGFRMTTYEENLANLERVFGLFAENNPSGHIIITLSPVPLRATFRSLNSLVANTASKSMLRAVIDDFTQRHPEQVTYFPAYEVVTVVEKCPYEEDNRHVRPETVDRIIALFESWFVERQPSIAGTVR